ncbi:Adenine phosphoribosyltransferase [Trichinella nativa]|uniref:adenine phosphoribosyltransferase n=1 Tax=Trichinella nativa TaxID=6335 RepID=A0A0V1LDW6_9BILA|nr:Adenine phosphoribosyltransferase [Trichinella nativa]
MKIPFIPIRKHEKLPGKLITVSYEYGEYGLANIFIIHEHMISSKCKKTTYCKRMLANVLLFDDILATGGSFHKSLFMKQFFDILCTAAAAVKLIEKSGATVSCAIFLANLTYLNGKQMLKNTPYYSVIQFHE